jgi:hypothetical protein
MHLTISGFKEYLEKYGFAINALQASFGRPVNFAPDSDTARNIVQQLDDYLPADQLASRRLWRNNCLSALAKVKSQQPK